MAEGKSKVEPIKVVLPKKPVPASTKNPRNLIIFSKPKVGKTELCAQLPNSLILDFENGTDLIDAVKINIESIAHLRAVGDQIVAEGYPYDYIILDTVTKLEEMCIGYAEEIYAKTVMGKKWWTEGKKKYGDITQMPQGAGYAWLRKAFERVIKYTQTLCPQIIQLAHVKDSMLEKNGIEVSASDLDLTGKIKRITASKSDAIGYLHRAKNNQNILSFKTTDDIACGARCPHLSNQEIVVSEKKDVDSPLITYWDKVFIK